MPRPSRAPISFEAAAAVAAARGPVQDRVAHSLPVSAIRPSPRNSRQRMTGIDGLAASIATHGLMQPVVVRRLTEGGYQLVAGHRRFAAVCSLGWTEIPAVVRDETQEAAYVLTLVENLQREDVTADEEVEALGVLIRERGWSVRKVAEAIKRDHLYVSPRLRVFEDAVLREPVLAEQLPVSTAEVLLRVKDQERRRALLREAMEQGWKQMDVRRSPAGAVGSYSPPSHIARSDRGPGRHATAWPRPADAGAARGATRAGGARLDPGQRREAAKLLAVVRRLVDDQPPPEH